jgi:glycerol-1-phosphatase
MGVGQGPGRNHLNAQQAFAAYEAIRHRLPAVPRPGRCQVAENLDAISDQFDAFFLDAFGVLNIGDTAIPGVPDRVSGLQQQGKRVLVVSNAASLTRADLQAKYAGLGFDFAPEDIITSRQAILKALGMEPDRRWGLMLPTGGAHHDIDRFDTVDLLDDLAAHDTADGFLLMGSGTWTEARQTLLEASLKRNPRPVLVGNPDIVAPRETGLSLEPGHFAHRLSDRTGITPRFFGKPFPNIFDLAFERVPGVDPHRILMVGDSLHTDILGGQAAGVQTALISGWGFFAGQDVADPIATSGIQPDYILANP